MSDNNLNEGREIKYKKIYDCNAWYGVNNLNPSLSVDANTLKNYISVLKNICKIPGILITSC